ncbi:S-adenosyl-L-methionine-dependent methyltransferase [Globomyces pollinis-pini]|nr:S-adenosyl-L-methionine-dependent methyltransferase [Globomyces pollinis-pini]
MHWLIQLNNFLQSRSIHKNPFFIRWPIKLGLLLVVVPLDIIGITLTSLGLLNRICFGGSVKDRGSWTSMQVTMQRFIGYVYGYCDDHLAVQLLSKTQLIIGLSIILKSIIYENVHVHQFVVERCNFGDQMIKELDSSFEQIVILGAGNDTRLHRLDHLPPYLFEIDAPSTQHYKLSKLKNPNPNVRFIPVNFELESWLEKLILCGFNCSRKTLFIWDGVLYYLTVPSYRSTLRDISKCAKGSKLAFDFGYTDNDRFIARVGVMVLKSIGEPFVSAFNQQQITKLLKEYNFNVEFFTNNTATKRDSSSVPRISYLAHGGINLNLACAVLV